MSLSRLPPWSLLIIGILPITAVLLFGGALPRQATLILCGLTMVWAAALTVAHWKRLDEPAKAAHRWAWYWGSSFGLGLAMIVAASTYMWPSLISFASPWAEALTKADRPPEGAWILLGVIFTGVAQATGFIGAFVYWWTLKR